MTANKLNIHLEPPVMIDQHQHDRLISVAEAHVERDPDVADRLLEELGRADIYHSNDMPDGVIRIGSMVTYRDENTKQDHSVCLSWPSDADISEKRISVVTPVGAALIGLAEGASIDWETNSGQVRHLTILSVKN